MQKQGGSVRFYKHKDGTRPSEDYIKKLPQETLLLFMAKMEYVRKWGKREVLCPYAHHILGGLWCVSVEEPPVLNHFIFYTITKKRALLVVHACRSKMVKAHYKHVQEASRLYHAVMQKENWHARV
jgi:phage-related protein